MRDKNLSHEAMLAMMERECAVIGVRNTEALDKVREELVAEYGEEGVRKVEERVIEEREKEWNI